jgi:AraC-like DNA-binding protein
VAEIAYRWGFGDQGQFSRHFKSHFGKTPREVRTEVGMPKIVTLGMPPRGWSNQPS